MPLFIGVHSIDGGVSIQDVAKAHVADLQLQGRPDLRHLRYWVAERDRKVFCLLEAPSREAATTVHREAHGLVAGEIHEVKEGV